jgi:cytokinesis protein
MQYGADHTIKHSASISQIATCLVSPHLPTRKTVADILTFLCHWDSPHGHRIVLKALDDLCHSRGEATRFDAWFGTLESTIDGRGRMGSLVGASDEIRSLRGREKDALREAANAGIDSGLNEYAVRLSLASASCLTELASIRFRTYT